MPRTLHRELRRLLRELALTLESGEAEDGTFRPALDVLDGDDTVEIRAELPGVEPDQLEVLISGQSLVLRGSKVGPPPTTEERLHFHRLERTQGAFERRVRLPDSLDLRRAEARLSGGVLRIVLPRVEDRRQSAWRVPVVDGDA